MRLVLDLQGAQGTSRERGIGRYSLALAQAIARNRGHHEVYVVLNGLFPKAVQSIRAAFDDILPQDNIQVWQAPAGLAPNGGIDNTWKRHVAELIREAFIGRLQPDLVHISSLFEGFGDDAVHSIGLHHDHWQTAVTLYDLIPLINKETYLTPNPAYQDFYLEKLEYLKHAQLFLAISESSRREVIDHLGVSEENIFNISAAVTGDFKPLKLSSAEVRAISLRYKLSKSFIMYSGATDERKNHLRLIKAYSLLPAKTRAEFQLVIVGGLPDEHRKKFEAYALTCGLAKSDLVITGRVTDTDMAQLYNLCKLFVFPAWHEGFGLPALEAMSCGAATIGANTSSIPEVIGNVDALFDPFDVKSITGKILEVLSNENFRLELIEKGLTQSKRFSWDDCARKSIQAFELLEFNKKTISTNSHFESINPQQWLIDSIAKIPKASVKDTDWVATAQAIARNQSPNLKKQILIDISELVHRDAKTGIQRVVRSILAELLLNPPSGYIIEPVYATSQADGYRYAKNFKAKFLGHTETQKTDEWIDFSNGDVFIGLDLQHHVVMHQANFYAQLQNCGVSVFFIVYDLLPVLLPAVFPDGAYAAHNSWLTVLAQTDGVICISRAVADEMLDWLKICGPKRLRPLNIGWFHLGADMSQSVPVKGLPENSGHVLAKLSKRPTFLMVGTIEPRKGQMQALLAFEKLWEMRLDINLVIVGKQGWNVDLLLEILRTHTELNHRLFWLDGVSDEYLDKVYEVSSCLIAASEGEGFGLPLIESAQYKTPILARDIPVFREVAGNHAMYFENSKSPSALSQKIIEWLDLHSKNMHPKVDDLAWLTWRQSTQQLLSVVLEKKWYQSWIPDQTLRFLGSDGRLGTQVGRRVGRSMITTGLSGYLIFGPYISLKEGVYKVLVNGSLNPLFASTIKADIVINKGADILTEISIANALSADCLTSLTVTLNENCEDFEIRLLVDSDCDLTVTSLEIHNITNLVSTHNIPKDVAVESDTDAFIQDQSLASDFFGNKTGLSVEHEKTQTKVVMPKQSSFDSKIIRKFKNRKHNKSTK
jgi:glycosyltransferase involved in cell wall biosynthesis